MNSKPKGEFFTNSWRNFWLRQYLRIASHVYANSTETTGTATHDPATHLFLTFSVMKSPIQTWQTVQPTCSATTPAVNWRPTTLASSRRDVNPFRHHAKCLVSTLWVSSPWYFLRCTFWLLSVLSRFTSFLHYCATICLIVFARTFSFTNWELLRHSCTFT